MLDPRISYEALKDEFEDDHDRTLLNQLEASKLALCSHFDTKYSSIQSPSRLSAMASSSMLSITSESNTGSPTKNYTARFQQKCVASDELTEFWNLPQEDFQSCDPVRWWYGHRAQFPNLYHLARDILSIPGISFFFLFIFFIKISCILGSAVAVERIFSGGRDTISLRRASLKPETIRVLMLVKRKLILKRKSQSRRR